MPTPGTPPPQRAPPTASAEGAVLGRLLRSSLVVELRRRRVPQVVATYGMISWGLVQLSATVFPLLNLPSWGPRAVLVMLIAGLPLTVFLAWTYDLTPDGLQRASSNPDAVVVPMNPAWRVGWLAFSLAMVAGGFWLALQRPEPEPEALATKQSTLPVGDFVAVPEAGSIAVLPFANLTSDSTTEYFADGVTEDIITALSKVGRLRVTSRTSVMQYKGEQRNLRDIARDLSVRHVIEGSVRRAGNQLRITVQLIDAQNDQHIWAETFDRELRDIFAIQSEIAQKVANALDTEIAPTEIAQLERTPTANPTAYDYYLQARDLVFKNAPAEREQIARLLRKALAIDPGYAEVYTLLGAHFHQKYFDSTDKRWLDSALTYARRALEIDPSVQTAHFLMARVYNTQSDPRAEESFRKGIALNPNTQDALWAASGLYSSLGRWDDYLRAARQVLAIEPARAQSYFLVADGYLMLGLLPEARAWLDRALQIQPDLWPARARLVRLHLTNRQLADAEREARALLALGLGGDRATQWMVRVLVAKREYLAAVPYVEHPNFQTRFERVFIYNKLGRQAEAAKALAQFEASEREFAQRGGGARPIGLSQIAFLRGDQPEGYRLLEQALKNGWQFSGSDGFGFTELFFPELKQEPRFKRLVEPYEQRLAAMRQRVRAEQL